MELLRFARAQLLLATVLGLGIVQDARSEASLDLSVGRFEIAPGMRLESVRLTAAAPGRAALLAVERMTIADNELTDLRASCDVFELHLDAFRCEGELTGLALGRSWRAAMTLRRERGASHLTLVPDGLLAGVRLSAVVEAGSSEARLSWEGVELAALAELLDSGFAIHDGTTSGRLTLRPQGDVVGFSGRLCVAELGFDAAEGTVAAAGLAVCAVLDGRQADGVTTLTAAVDEPPVGEVLAGTVYLELASVAPTFDARLTLASNTLTVERLAWRDPAVGGATVAGRLPIDGAGTGSWTVEIDSVDLGAAVSTYLATALEAAGLTVAAAGQVRGRASVVDASLEHVTLDLDGVGVVDGAGRFEWHGLTGLLDYSASGDSSDSRLGWDSALLYRLPIGPADLRFFAGGQAFQVLDPLTMDVLDGALSVGTLNLSTVPDEGLSIDFEAELAPISLSPITEALGWPPLEGQISGRVPRIRLRDGVIEMGGALEVLVFDGRIVARNLRIERLFGVLPTFAADLAFEALDLQRMTGAFSFGEITGTLDGRVDGLRLLDWQPVAFDLALGTPEDDRRRHRISQRAVDNLTSIGGGPSAVLSSTFLRFFERFDYDRLGIRCRLVNNICTMGGVARSPSGGYYIVKGAGIPRIDVIGFSTVVDFPQLLRRLRAATESGAPSIGG